jgi:hypothetical protein
LKTYLAFLAFLTLFPVQSLATNYYISNTEQGSHDCTSWANACTLADISCVYGGTAGIHSALWADGNNFYIDGGPSGMTYTSQTLVETCNPGFSTGITIATGAAHSTLSSGHDGLVTFDGGGTAQVFIYILNYSKITLNGEKSGAINWVFQNALIVPAVHNRTAVPVVTIGDSGSGITTNATIKYLEINGATDGISVTSINGFDVSYNWVHNIYSIVGIDGRAAPDGALGTNKIHHNRIENAYNDQAQPTDCPGQGNVGCGPDGVQTSGNVDIYNNTFTTRIGTTSWGGHPDAIQGGWHKERVWNNFFLGNPMVIQNSSDCGAAAARTDVWFFNNVVISSTGGIQLLLMAAPSITRLYFLNNDIMSSPATWTLCDNASTASDFRTQNNIFDHGSWNIDHAGNDRTWPFCAQADVLYSNNTVTASSSLNCAASAKSQTSGQTVLPSFVNYSVGNIASDLRLTASYGNGVNLTALCSTTPALCFDISGAARPSSGAWTIGAYEYTSTSNTSLSTGAAPKLSSGAGVKLQ